LSRAQPIEKQLAGIKRTQASRLDHAGENLLCDVAAEVDACGHLQIAAELTASVV
jgi:hypothetical protein